MIRKTIMMALGLTVGSCFMSSTSSWSDERRTFSQMMSESMRSAPAKQRFSLGPLSDGQTIVGEIQYIENLRGVGVRKDKDGRICINVDRRDAAIAGFAVDASIHCQINQSCGRLPEYVRMLHSIDGDVMAWPRFEQFETALAPALRNWKRTDTYARAWLTGFNSYIVGMQFHEIGHVAFDHKATSVSEQALKQEAEADGFAAFVTHTTGHSIVAASIPILSKIDAQSQSRVDEKCRAAALVSDLKAWFRDHLPSHRLTKSLPHKIPLNQFGSRFDFSRSLQPITGAERARCAAYDSYFADGVEKAQALFTPDTTVDSTMVEREICVGR